MILTFSERGKDGLIPEGISISWSHPPENIVLSHCSLAFNFWLKSDIVHFSENRTKWENIFRDLAKGGLISEGFSPRLKSPKEVPN